MSNRDLFAKPEDIFHWGIKGLIRNVEGGVLVMETILPQGAQWDLPGGRVHKGGDVTGTLRREIEEETGFSDFAIGSHMYTGLAKTRIPFDQCTVGLILSVFEVFLNQDGAVVLSDEHGRYAWKRPAEAAALLSAKFPDEFVEILKSVK